jgi:anaerobic magnesium-protoporphyrin IX monomethyl ester cyclase
MVKDTVILFHPSAYPREIISAVPYEFLHLERMVRGKVRLILIDEQINPDYFSIISENLDRLLLAGVSTMTGYQLKGARTFSLAVKAGGNIPVVWGSWHPSLLPEQVLKEDFVDYIISGQGELAFMRLVEGLKNNTPVDQIPNLGYKKDEQIIINPREKLLNPDEFPPVNFDIINVELYTTPQRYSERTMWYFTSIGCPSACGFCSMAIIYGKAWWHRPIDEAITHLKYLKEKAKIGAVRFEDSTFFVNRKFTIDFCQRLVEEKLNILWIADAQAARFLKLFSDKDIDLMYDAGLRQVFIGAETGDSDVLEKISKESTVEDNLEIVRKLKKHDIKPTFGIMLCFPWNPDKDFRNTVRMIMKAKLIDPRLDVSLNFFKPVPGTPMFDVAIQHGFVPPDTIDGWLQYMMVRFQAPWSPRNYTVKLRIIKKIYFPIMTPGIYKKIKGYKKILFLLAVILFRPPIFFRFKTGSMKFPIEGYLIYYSVLIFNRITGLNWGLGRIGKKYAFKDF